MCVQGCNLQVLGPFSFQVLVYPEQFFLGPLVLYPVAVVCSCFVFLLFSTSSVAERFFLASITILKMHISMDRPQKSC